MRYLKIGGAIIAILGYLYASEQQYQEELAKECEAPPSCTTDLECQKHAERCGWSEDLWP